VIDATRDVVARVVVLHLTPLPPPFFFFFFFFFVVMYLAPKHGTLEVKIWGEQLAIV